MKKSKALLLVFITLFLIKIDNASAQQDPQYTQYMYNMSILNPGYVGTKGVWSIGLLGRSQWVNVDGAPKTATLSVNGPLWKRLSGGLSVVHDEIGPARENNLYLDLAYSIKLTDESNLSLGIKGGFTFLNVGLLSTNQANDPLNIPVNQTQPNFGAGLFYYTDKMYIGLSAPNLLKTRHLEHQNNIVNTSREETHYFLTGGYVLNVSEGFKLKPSAMVKAVSGAPLSVDLSANMLFEEKFEIGLSYRFDDSISGMLAMNLNKDFRIGYAYDYTTSNFGQFNSGSHEIMILIDFYRRSLKSPRFF